VTDVAVADAVEIDLDERRRGPLRVLFSAAWKQHRTKIGLGITLLLVGIAVFGRLVAPYEPDQGVEGLLPFAPPSSDAWLGTDALGRDVLSRFLYGGLSVLVLSGVATAIGMSLGITVGLLAAYSRGKLDDLLMRTMDVFISLPSIVLAIELNNSCVVSGDGSASCTVFPIARSSKASAAIASTTKSTGTRFKLTSLFPIFIADSLGARSR